MKEVKCVFMKGHPFHINTKLSVGGKGSTTGDRPLILTPQRSVVNKCLHKLFLPTLPAKYLVMRIE